MIAAADVVHLDEVEQGGAEPGDAQHAYSNILKASVRDLYLSEDYALPRQATGST